MKKLPVLTEHAEQVAFINWTYLPTTRFKYPKIEKIFAIPNGGARPQKSLKGIDVPLVGWKLKKEGVKAGVWDLFLPVPLHGYHGLFIEMKRKGGRMTLNQKEWGEYFESVGYACVVCQGCEDAKVAVDGYYGDKMRKEES